MAHILLVEDDDDVRAVIQQALIDGGHWLVTAPDYDVAESVLHAGGLDLVITNVFLTGGTGRRLAEVAAIRGVPVLFITGDFGQMTALKAEGASLLRKPFRLQELHDAVAAGLGGARAWRDATGHTPG